MVQLRSRLSGLALLVLMMLTVFIALGCWQLQRMTEKKSILATEVAHGNAEPVALPEQHSDYSAWRYRAIHATGSFTSDHQFLLDNQVMDGQVGFNVYTPLNLPGGDTVLVDRGWVKQSVHRQQLPDLTVGEQHRSIEGQLYTAFGEGVRLGSVDNDRTEWPRVIQYVDYQQLSERLGQSLLPVIIRLSADAPDGYRRQWSIVPFGPERHLGYAVQWFALALAMAIIFIILVRKKL